MLARRSEKPNLLFLLPAVDVSPPLRCLSVFRKVISETKNVAPQWPDTWQQLLEKGAKEKEGRKKQEGDEEEGPAEESTEEAER